MAVSQQPGKMLVAPVEGTRDWESGVLDCCTDCKSLLCAYCCMPCTICDISKRLGEFMCVAWFVPGALIGLRTRLRTLGGIRGSMCNDCLVMSCCAACAVCQMDREMQAMGL